MPANVFVKTLRDYRWQVFWYGIGLASLAALVVFIYPSYREQLADFEIPDALRAFIGESDYGSPQGYLAAEFFSWVPILVVVFAIMAGTSALAGEETGGTLDLQLAQPISRRRLILEKMAGFALSAVMICALTSLGWLVSVPFVDIDISYSRLILATLQIVPLILLVGAMAFSAAALLPDRRQATGIVTAVTVVSFFVNYLASLVEVLAPLRWTSLFFYHNGANALTGLDLPKLSVLVLTTVAFALLATASFDRREIGVHGAFSLPWLRRHQEPERQGLDSASEHPTTG